MTILKVTRLCHEARLPEYAHAGDSGMDLFSLDECEIHPGETILVHTGISVELPENTEAQIRPRSGLALKNSITVLNSPGTIDQGYRGEIGIILINHSDTVFNVTKHMKIAQMVIVPVLRVDISEVDNLSSTERSEGGFGSTGV